MSLPVGAVRVTAGRDVKTLKSAIRALGESLGTTSKLALGALTPAIRAIVDEVTGNTYLTLADMRRIKPRPYSYAGSPPQPPGIINMQSGEFHASFVVTPAVIASNRVLMQVVSISDKAEMLLTGTERMVARPYKVLIQRKVKDLLRENLPTKLRQYFRIRSIG